MNIISDENLGRKITLELSEKELNTILATMAWASYDDVSQWSNQILNGEDYNKLYKFIRELIFNKTT